MRVNSLKGKKIVFLGSSVTYGWASDGISFADLLAQTYGVDSKKYAVSGTTLSAVKPCSYVERLNKIEEAGLDCFVCQLSTNDATQKIALGSEKADTSCILGAISHIAVQAKSRWGCPVLFYANPHYESEEYAAMVRETVRLSQALGFSFLNLYEDEKFNAITASKRNEYMADAIHPTRLGYEEWLLPVFAAALQDLLS